MINKPMRTAPFFTRMKNNANNTVSGPKSVYEKITVDNIAASLIIQSGLSILICTLSPKSVVQIDTFHSQIILTVVVSNRSIHLAIQFTMSTTPTHPHPRAHLRHGETQPCYAKVHRQCSQKKEEEEGDRE
jgi:hypothetical protein